MNNTKRLLILFVFVLFVIAIGVQMRNNEQEDNEQAPETQETKTDMINKLPHTVQVEDRDKKAETIAYRL
ncbi:hypothetical protein ERJ70_04110 [Sediminibacillus dalangtanensis]|uniref:Uncharacterized protein n=1 Tax=Sediminibacillus dalangtanensis TaxID=2729421 RepID=A0ABX7VNW4_9BACI|nr:hypothetical protein [Sediminibacillus dalangtanensis]QTM98552.1 hypothetical protein ERJ70_04110 [Sediminibacillus dalangtanensis]